MKKSYKTFDHFCPLCSAASHLLKKKNSYSEYFCAECTIEFEVRKNKVKKIFDVQSNGERIVVDIYVD